MKFKIICGFKNKQGNFKDFEAQITALKEELGARNADISVLNLEIKTLGKDVDSLQRQHTEAAEEVKALRDKLAAAQREADQAKTAGADSDREITELRETIS